MMMRHLPDVSFFGTLGAINKKPAKLINPEVPRNASSGVAATTRPTDGISTLRTSADQHGR